MKTGGNIAVLILRITGLLVMFFSIYIANFIGNSSDLYLVFGSYTQMVALIVGFTGVVSGIAFFGKAEQVKLLHNIHKSISNEYEAKDSLNKKDTRQLDS